MRHFEDPLAKIMIAIAFFYGHQTKFLFRAFRWVTGKDSNAYLYFMWGFSSGLYFITKSSDIFIWVINIMTTAFMFWVIRQHLKEIKNTSSGDTLVIPTYARLMIIVIPIMQIFWMVVLLNGITAIIAFYFNLLFYAAFLLNHQGGKSVFSKAKDFVKSIHINIRHPVPALVPVKV